MSAAANPFVLGRSLLEAMSAGCAIVGSDTAPVREVVQHSESGLLVDFFDPSRLADTVADLLADAPMRQRLGSQARSWAQAHCDDDLHSICLPQQRQWLQALLTPEKPVAPPPKSSGTDMGHLRQALTELRSLLAVEA